MGSDRITRIVCSVTGGETTGLRRYPAAFSCRVKSVGMKKEMFATKLIEIGLMQESRVDYRVMWLSEITEV